MADSFIEGTSHENLVSVVPLSQSKNHSEKLSGKTLISLPQKNAQPSRSEKTSDIIIFINPPVGFADLILEGELSNPTKNDVADPMEIPKSHSQASSAEKISGKGCLRGGLPGFGVAKRPFIPVNFLNFKSPSTSLGGANKKSSDALPLNSRQGLLLDEVAARRGNDATQALFALTLQAATMSAQAAREFELRPSVSKLKAELEAERKMNADFAERLVRMEKESLNAAKRASLQVEHLQKANDLLRDEVVEVRGTYCALIKEVAMELEMARSLAEEARKEVVACADRLLCSKF
ncbi:hypothetical protein OROMI_019417 [Orobanche minor]